MSTNLNKKRKLADISNTKNQIELNKVNQKTQALVVDKKSGKINEMAKRSSSNARDKSHDKRQQDKSIDKKLKNEHTNKVLKSQKAIEQMSESDSEVEIGNQVSSQVIISNMFSIYALAEKQPQRIKSVIDEIFKHKDNSEEFLIKTMFLYFLELMGLAEKESLEFMCNFIARNKDESKLLKLFNDEEKLDVSFEKLVFFSHEKKAVLQKKLLKKVCKIFIANMIDVLPDKENYLTSIVERVCVLSLSKQRLVRYSFTYVGLYIFKFLLSQYHDLVGIKSTLESQQKAHKKQKISDTQTTIQIRAIEEAMSIIKASFCTIQKHLIIKRGQDCTEMVRKSVYEFLQQLEQVEVQELFNKENTEIFDLVFASLKDEDQSIRRIALQLISHLLNKMSSEKGTLQLIQTQLLKNKLQIFKMAMPSEKQQDVPTMVKALQVIQKMVEIVPDIYNQDHLQMLLNLVHFQNQSVREEAGSILMVISNEFDDSNSLLELQKIQASKTNYDEFVVNFIEEPNKSQKQLLKLVHVFAQHVQTRSQYIKQNSDESDEQVFVPNMQKDQIQKILSSDCEERAILLFQTFYRKTSVIYDVQSMTNLLKKEDIDQDTLQVLANLISISIQFINSQKNQTENQNLIFRKLWDISTSFMKLTVVNELLQTYRVNLKILDPLLKVLMAVSQYTDKDSTNDQGDELGKDLTLLLLKLVSSNEVSENHPETQSIIKNSFLNLVQLQQFFPSIHRELAELALNFNEKLKRQVVPKLFTQDQDIESQISFIFKFNILMSQVPLSSVSDSDYLKGMSSFAITNLSQMIIDNHFMVEKLSKIKLTALLQVPFTFMEQLLSDQNQQNDLQSLQFHQKMLTMLLEFYHDLFQHLKSNEVLQTVVLQFIVESLILSGGESKSKSSTLVMGLNDFPKVKDLLNELVQTVSTRIKCNELIIQEQFQILLGLFTRDFNSLLSEIGVEFLINFGTSKDQAIIKDIRKLYYSYKQRDRPLTGQQKGIFYSFLFKCVTSIFSLNEVKALRIIDMSPNDLKKELASQGLEKLDLSQHTFSKVLVTQQFVKTFQNSVMLLVIQNKQGPSSNGLTKQEDEKAYFKLVENLIRFSLNSRDNFYALLTLKTFLHKNFLNLKYQESLMKGLKAYYDSVKSSMNIDDASKDNEIMTFILKQVEDKVNASTIQTTGKKGKKAADDSNVNVSDVIEEQKDLIADGNENQKKPKQKKVGDKDVVESLQKIGKKRGASEIAKNQTESNKQEDHVAKNGRKQKKMK